MDDAESPDAESRKDDQTRRAGLRLRDAEAVAATRRDMFGDGSLLDTLAGTPAAPEEQPVPADALPGPSAEGLPAAHAEDTNSADGQPPDPEPADPHSEEMPSPDAQPESVRPPDAQPADADAAAGDQDTSHDPAEPALPGALAQQPQSLDAIIDSFPEEPPDPEGSELQQPGSGAALPPLFSAPEDAFDADGPHSSRASISAIFNTLDAIGGRAEEAQPDPAALAPEPPASDGPGSDGSPVGQEVRGNDGSLDDVIEGDSAQDPASGSADPPAEPAAQEQDLAMPPFPGAPGGAPPDPREWPPFPELPGTAADSAYPEPSVQPPYIEPPATGMDAPQRAEPAGLPPFPQSPPATGEAPPGPVFSDMPPFLEPPPAAAGMHSEWPPFPEPPGAGDGPVASEPSVSPPFIELPAARETDVPQYMEPAPPAEAGEPPLAAPYPGGPSGGLHFSERREPPLPRDVGANELRPALDEATAASVDATARIAEEANATAQALDNLQRLLDQNSAVTEPAPVASLSTTGVYPGQRTDLNPFPPTPPTPFVPPPVPVPDRGPGRGIYLLGFVTGLGLSLIAGAALYFLINTS